MRARPPLRRVVLLIGLGLMGLGHLMAGSPTPPLFDGVVVEDPYRFVAPPPGGVGDPLAASAVALVVNGSAPLVAVATQETPPQAQMIAQADAFSFAGTTTSLAVSIEPIAPTDPRIAGNEYRFLVTDQAGVALGIVPGALVTIVLRAPQPDPGALLARLDGDQWVTLPTEHGGLPDLYAANVAQLGDFAVLASGAIPSASAAAPSATVSARSPSPSAAPGKGPGVAGIPTWLIALIAIAAVGAGLTWGLLTRGEDD